MKLRLTPLVVAVLFVTPSAFAQTPPDATPPPDAAAPTGKVTTRPPASQTEIAQTQPTTQPETKKEAPKASWTDKVKISGKAYLRYSWELAESAHGANQFNVDRLYLQTEFMPVDKVRFQVTLDAGDTRNQGNQVFFAETKYAFAEYKDFLPGLYVRGGIIPLAWIPYEEDVWGYRVQGAMPEDRWGYITSSDLGVSVGGNLPSKFGSFQVNLSNGEGYKLAEILKRKEVQGRLTINPLASAGGALGGIFLTGYGSYGLYDDAGLTARTKVRAIGQAGIQTTAFTLAAEYAFNRDSNAKVKGRFVVGPESLVNGNVFSAYGALRPGAIAPAVGGLELFARFDAVDPDSTTPDNQFQMVVGGAAYKFAEGVKLLADYEGVYFADAAGGQAAQQQRIKVHGEFKF